MPIEIRPARPDEYGAIAELTLAAYRTIDPDLGAYEARIRDVASRAARAVVLVAAEDGHPLGTATYVDDPASALAESPSPDDAGLRMLAVSPEAGGRGIGTALVEACLERARAAGFRRLVLLTRPSMTVAQRIYARLGFRRAPELDEELPEVRLLGFARELGDPQSGQPLSGSPA